METNLPHDVLMNILSRLPLRSVIRCKSACKAWLALLEDPYFAEIHIDRQSSDPCAVSFFVLGLAHYSKDHFKFYIEDLIDDDEGKLYDTSLVTPVNHPPTSDDMDDIRVIGSCNGLVCLSLWRYGRMERIVVYNPVTMEYVKILPHHGMEFFSQILYGFGYHRATREYKILRINKLYDVDAKVHVYTLGSGTWRIRETRIQNYRMPDPMVHLDESLYWLCYDTKGVHIGSFDLGDEELRMMAGPHGSQFVVPDPFNYCYSLTSLEGNLCVIEGMGYHEMNIWVMKRDKKNNVYSWSKGFTIPESMESSILHDPNGRNSVVLFTKGDKVMGLVCMPGGARYIFCFDTERTSIQRYLASFSEKIEDKNIYMCWGVVSYMRSIVSLKALGREDAKMAVPAAATVISRIVSHCRNLILWLFRLLMNSDGNNDRNN